jgi:hypothetical protein
MTRTSSPVSTISPWRNCDLPEPQASSNGWIRAAHARFLKYNKKTVTVVTDEGVRWNVSPGLLRRAEPKDITPEAGNVVQIK